MYNLQKNNYHQKPKASNIQTPPAVSQFIFELLGEKFPKGSLILDPCSGKGNLIAPWKENGYPTWGIDIDTNSNANVKMDFFTLKPYKSEANLILCNPPFNGYGHKLGSEVWLDKIIELFGKEIPIALFAPVGFCANLTQESRRFKKFVNGTYPPISSVITLPKNIFEGVIFHSEILIFNIPKLKPHYFLNHVPTNL